MLVIVLLDTSQILIRYKNKEKSEYNDTIICVKHFMNNYKLHILSISY